MPGGKAGVASDRRRVDRLCVLRVWIAGRQTAAMSRTEIPLSPVELTDMANSVQPDPTACVAVVSTTPPAPTQGTQGADRTMTRQEVTSSNRCIACLQNCRGSRRLVLLIVAVALLLDNMLLSTVVPIIPTFLYQLRHPHHMADVNATLPPTFAESSVTSTPYPVQSAVHRTCKCEQNASPGRKLSLHLHSNEEGGGDPMDGDTVYNEGGPILRMPTSTPSVDDYVDNATEEMETTTMPAPVTEEFRHEDLINENVEVGVMFASKPIVQAITNPFIGPLTNRIGYSIPMFSGFVIMFLSTIIFATGKDYPTLFLARSLQGVGSACTSVAGMGMLADVYPDDRERGNAMAIALGGLALGVLIGPPFGGVMYEFVGKSSPFVVLACLALLDGMLQLLVLQPKVSKEEQEGASLLALVKDPYILVAAGAITFANMGIAILEPSMPLWMMDTMHSPKWQQGAAFLPASISYLVGTNIFGPMGHKMGRWLASMVGLVMIGLCLVCIPFATKVTHLILPNAGIGFAIGMVDSSMMPMLGYLVDIRHTSVYGSVYAIGDVAFCVGFAVGPALSGTIVKAIGFPGLVYCIAITCLLYAPLMVILKKPPGRDEDKVVVTVATPLGVCTREEQRAVIRFLWAEAVGANEIHSRMLEQYGGNCLGKVHVYDWIEAFENGETALTDDQSGTPSTANAIENSQPVVEAVNDRRIVPAGNANGLNLSNGLVNKLLTLVNSNKNNKSDRN